MSRKTFSAYDAVLKFFTELIKLTNLELVMIDFEHALRKACKKHFPRARVVGCHVHHERVRIRKKISTVCVLLVIKFFY